MLVLRVYTRTAERQDTASRARVYRQGPTDEPLIALTFDDGPSPRWTPEILDVLALHRVPATFFVSGRQARKCPELVQRAAVEGHCIGSHGDTHNNLTLLTARRVAGQLADSSGAISAATGRKPRLFRPPYGAYDRRLLDLLAREDLTMVLWSVDSLDWWLRDANRVAERICRRVRRGCIVLLHDAEGARVAGLPDSREGTVDALPVVIGNALSRGYRFVTVEELLHLSDGGPAAHR